MACLDCGLSHQLPAAGQGGGNPAEPNPAEHQSEQREEERFGPVPLNGPLNGQRGRERSDSGKGEQKEDEASCAQVGLFA